MNVDINDNTVLANQADDSLWGAFFPIGKQLLTLLRTAHTNNRPIVVNISMGPHSHTPADDQQFYNQIASFLSGAERQFPGILDNAVILVAGSDKPRDETAALTSVQNRVVDSKIWKSLYFVESSEGAAGCGIGYSMPGTTNVISAKGCSVSIPGTACVTRGTSFAAPALANLVAQAFLKSGSSVSLVQITTGIWTFQKNAGRLPTVSELLNALSTGSTLSSGDKFVGNLSGVFSGVDSYAGCAWNATLSGTMTLAIKSANSNDTFEAALTASVTIQNNVTDTTVVKRCLPNPGSFVADSPQFEVSTGDGMSFIWYVSGPQGFALTLEGTRHGNTVAASATAVRDFQAVEPGGTVTQQLSASFPVTLTKQ